MYTLWFVVVFLGMAFWKVPSRKLFAVNSCSSTKRKRRFEYSDDSDDDFLPPISIKKERGRYAPGEVETLLQNMAEVKKTLGEILEVTNLSHLPFGLKKAILDSFRCSMCLQITEPPVIVAKCCRNILGCSKCVTNLYSGEDALTKTCPLCRAERGYSEIMTLNGLDPFLNLIKKIEPEEALGETGSS